MDSLLASFLKVLLISSVGINGEPISVTDMCIANTQAPYSDESNSQFLSISENLFTSNQFGLYSPIFPHQPPNGSPIRFEADGNVQSEQFVESRWSVSDHELILHRGNSKTIFRYHAKCGTLATFIEVGDEDVIMEIAIISSPTEKRPSK